MIKLKKVEIDKYKSFLEKQEIDIEDGVTRIVGKNESGKTALLEAMAKFNYFDSSDDTFKFNSTNEEIYTKKELEEKNVDKVKWKVITEILKLLMFIIIALILIIAIAKGLR